MGSSRNDPDLQPALFGAASQPALFDAGPQPAPQPADVVELARRLDERYEGRIHLGTSSWNFPGWRGLVWDAGYPEQALSRQGLAAYGAHPLLRTVSVDRSFYRPLDVATFAGMAAQVPPSFRFVVKAPALVADAVVREPGDGRPARPNPAFLDPATALESFVRPALRGLGNRLGVLVFQLSPLPSTWTRERGRFLEKLGAMLSVARAELPQWAGVAVELRDASLVSPDLASLLKAEGASYCLGLHDRMPAAEQQLPMLRALWPGPLVCRWSLRRGLKYEQAKGLYAPFDRLAAPDPQTRDVLARVAAATAAAGFHVFITINNKAEGSAPLSVIELARAIDARGEEVSRG